MHSRIVKLLALGAVLIAALPVAALAQTSRIEGMSIQGDYIKDYTAIYTYPSQVSNIGNVVYGELGAAGGGSPEDRAVGAIMGDIWEGKYGTWAIHMRQVTPQLGQGDTTSSPAPGVSGRDPNVNGQEQFDIMWGKKIGTRSFGIGFHRSFGQWETESPGPITSNLEYDFLQGVPGNPNFSRNVLGVSAGMGWELNPSTNMEIAGHWQSRTFEASGSPPPSTFAEDGKTTYQVAARAWWQWQPNVMVVPVFKWYSYDLSTSTSGTPAVDNSLRGWQLGMAGNWTIGSNDLFVMGLTLAQNKVETKADIFGFGFDNGTVTETFTPQIFAALETHVNNWLTLRFGGNKGAWHRVELEDNDATPGTRNTYRDSPFSMSLGAGAKVGSLQLDAVMNDSFPHNGLYFVSGSNTSPLFSKVSATYSF